MASVVSGYIDSLIGLLNPIEFHSTTLGAANLIKKYERSVNSTPNTEVNVFEDVLGSNELESRLNKRLYNIVVRIRTNAVNREEQAQLDLYELEQEIVEVLENSLSKVAWGNGYLQNTGFESRSRNFFDNYYTKDIPVIIAQRVAVTV